MKSRLLDLYKTYHGHRPEAIVDLRADGSNRSLYRLMGPDGSSVIGVWGPDAEENRAFISFSRSFRGIGLPVPEIHAVDEEAGIYIEEDLGDTTLFAALTAARTGEELPAKIMQIYRSVVELLPRVQVEGGKVVDYSVAYPCTEFDRQSMMWDLNYFKYHFLKLAHIPFNEARLEADFHSLCDYLLQADRTHFLYRDFQSRNIMLRDGVPWLIDYQGGRRGALQYDIASLLYDAKADIPDPVRDELLEHYLDSLAPYMDVERGEFRQIYRGYVLIRIMQALGAYGYRGFFEKKAHFLASVPYAISNIEKLLEQGLPVHMPELRAVLERIAGSDIRHSGVEEAADPEAHTPGGENGRASQIGPGQPSSVIANPGGTQQEQEKGEPEGLERNGAEGKGAAVSGAMTREADAKGEDARGTEVQGVEQKGAGPKGMEQKGVERKGAEPQASETGRASLTVTITSFSYRRGYPPDRSEHGGGFVFDCRALHNPGRYAPYKSLCGRDADVMEFLEREEKVGDFWKHVLWLVENAVENYLERNFSNLSVSFGCTGGQHRSVYFAERLARHLREHYPNIQVVLGHREEEVWGKGSGQGEAGSPEPSVEKEERRN